MSVCKSSKLGIMVLAMRSNQSSSLFFHLHFSSLGNSETKTCATPTVQNLVIIFTKLYLYPITLIVIVVSLLLLLLILMLCEYHYQ